MDNLSIHIYSRGELNNNFFVEFFFPSCWHDSILFFPLVLFFNYTSESMEDMGASLLRSTEHSFFSSSRLNVKVLDEITETTNFFIKLISSPKNWSSFLELSHWFWAEIINGEIKIRKTKLAGVFWAKRRRKNTVFGFKKRFFLESTWKFFRFQSRFLISQQQYWMNKFGKISFLVGFAEINWKFSCFWLLWICLVNF